MDKVFVKRDIQVGNKHHRPTDSVFDTNEERKAKQRERADYDNKRHELLQEMKRKRQ